MTNTDRTLWPKLCSLAEAARLFTDFGYPITRPNVSRWVTSHNFARTDGKVDPNALFDVWAADYSRQVMSGKAGQTASAPASTPTPGAQRQLPTGDSGDENDPSRQLKRLQAQKLRTEMEAEAGNLVPAEEVAASTAEAIANLRAAFAEGLNDAAKALVRALALPAHREALIRDAFKAYAYRGQEAFAARCAAVLAESTPEGMDARDRVEALVALDLQLRGLADDADDEAPADDTPPALDAAETDQPA